MVTQIMRNFHEELKGEQSIWLWLYFWWVPEGLIFSPVPILGQENQYIHFASIYTIECSVGLK